ncbi:MAG: hypothetical protein QNJ44_11855 [Rhodobacter sp.]|nr:hypothetical protein [Rhodobacter sp.]
MLGTVILGILAGLGAQYAEPHVKKAMEAMMLAEVPISAMELRLFSFSVCLVAAAILAWLFGDGSALALAVGAAIGVFGPRVIDRYRNGGGE